MSLIHWWPLNGNTNDYGVNNIALINNGATVNSAGKIGSCYYFDGNTSYLQATIEAGLFDGTGHPFSFTFWMKFTDELVDRKIIFGDYSLANPYFNIEMSYGSASYSGRIRFCWSNGCDYWFTVATGIKDTWQHYAITYDGINKISLYKDGTFIESATATLNAASSGTYYIGRDGRTGSTALKGYLNDFRIYDHALSAKEVKEISKGLVLHYNFEDEYIEPTTNLSTRNGCDGWANSGAATRTNNDTSLTAPEPTCPIYSITQTAAGQAAITFGTTSSSVPSKTLTASVWFYMSGNHTGSNNIGPYIRSNKTNGSAGTLEYKGDTNFRNWPNNTWIKLTKTFTTNSEETTLYFCAYSANLNEKFAFNGWQIEENNHATPYVNGTRSAGKVYDNSGYGYNGTNNGVILSNDSISGKVSAQFAPDAYIEIPSLPQFNKVTYSMWVKIPSNAQAYRSIFIPKGDPVASGIWLSVNTEGANLWAYQGGNAPSYCKGTSTPLSADTWYLYTHTFDGTTGQNYLNGVAIGSATTYTTRTYIPSGVYTLGDSYTGTTWSGTPFDGKIADFKIYATVLSAEDILAEYNRKAAIDKNGNLFTGEIIETGWSGTTILTLSDIFNTNAVYVDKTSWAETIMDAARVNASFQPTTTYYIRYKVQRLAYPVSHSYTTQAWAKTMLYNDSSSIDCAQLSQTAYTSMVPGECKWVTGSFTTPSSLSNWRMLFYSARWSGSNSDWGSNAEVETVRVSDFYISTTPFTHTNVSIENENLIYSTEIHELSDSSVKIFKNGELRTSSVEEL